MYDENGSGGAQGLKLDRRADPPAPVEPQRPSAPEAEKQEPPKDEKPQKRGRGRLGLWIGLGVIVLLCAAVAGGLWWDDSSRYESTDDAFIASRQISIAPMVSGNITNVPVTDNQHVKTGDVIATIDDRTYQAALAQANAQVLSAKASVTTYDAQIDSQKAQVEQARAQLDAARAALVFAQQQASRYEDLAKTGAGSAQNAQQYSSSLIQQQATVKNAEAALTLADRQIEVLQAQRANAQAQVEQAAAQRDTAALNESYTTVRALEPGRVVQLGAGVGAFEAVGASLTMFVPDQTWIVANFKETQLDRIRPGQPVSFSIDAYPERDFHGHVDSVQPGSGTAFSLLPAENATGNYVKIVQRVPVKLIIDNLPTDVALGPGMSVVPTVRVDPSPSYYERLRTRWRAKP